MGPPAKLRPKIRDFDPKKFLATIGEGRKVLTLPKKQAVFSQGDAADAIFSIQQGKVKLMVVSNNGKEATLGILSTGDFFGEGSLAGQTLRMGSATAMTALQTDPRKCVPGEAPASWLSSQCGLKPARAIVKEA